ncbi:hypothetical protein SAMN02745148_00343 [Modicisalibacter ilicicola DSM 19980]|uniref:Phosphoglycerol transferase MdoB n=1 Tax=Modicisalibacter ilicicola DSM 19980 TaxID=1121942 RepID=A0A1M4T5R6_9GAMM|nr:hypothetical protein [Halomonas ilicicola]SHE39667.1 hypothetical protein SAMN02745148_00343 [Halomonas ilicicola DSM 19980]
MYHILALVFALDALFLGLHFLVEGGLGTLWLSLEAIWVVLFLAILPGRWRHRIVALLAVCLTLLIFLALIDALTRLAFGRLFNPLLDIGLADSAWHQLTQNLGTPLALVVVSGILAVLGFCTWAIAWCLNRPPWPTLPRRLRLALGLVLIAFLLPGLPGPSMLSPHLGTPGLNLVATHWQQVGETRQAYADFEQRLARKGPLAARALPALAGHDVILGFIESYGLSALFDPRYARHIEPRLSALERRLGNAGIHVATGKLISPVQGGQSWLAHATLLSGLWLETQRHYELLLAQRQSTLIDDFLNTGHRSLAIMPALTQPWPEGRRLGYERIFSARDIPYQGPALNWVTMPDQFTWHFFETLRRQQNQPVFAELALISSHAPWTPILPIVDDWESLDDGRLFERWAGSGETPEQLWRDMDRVRDHYAKALDYALAAAFGYADRYLPEKALLILVGDHQPAPLIVGDQASRAVPVHVLSRDIRLTRPFLEAGFTAGILPGRQAPTRPMDDFRPLLHRLFGD